MDSITNKLPTQLYSTSQVSSFPNLSVNHIHEELHQIQKDFTPIALLSQSLHTENATLALRVFGKEKAIAEYKSAHIPRYPFLYQFDVDSTNIQTSFRTDVIYNDDLRLAFGITSDYSRGLNQTRNFIYKAGMFTSFGTNIVGKCKMSAESSHVDLDIASSFNYGSVSGSIYTKKNRTKEEASLAYTNGNVKLGTICSLPSNSTSYQQAFKQWKAAFEPRLLLQYKTTIGITGSIQTNLWNSSVQYSIKHEMPMLFGKASVGFHHVYNRAINDHPNVFRVSMGWSFGE